MTNTLPSCMMLPPARWPLSDVSVCERLQNEFVVTRLSSPPLTKRKGVLCFKERTPERGFREEVASYLSPHRLCRFAIAVSDAARGEALLGLSICSNRLGETSQSGKDHRL